MCVLTPIKLTVILKSFRIVVSGPIYDDRHIPRTPFSTVGITRLLLLCWPSRELAAKLKQGLRPKGKPPQPSIAQEAASSESEKTGNCHKASTREQYARRGAAAAYNQKLNALRPMEASQCRNSTRNEIGHALPEQRMSIVRGV